MIKLVSRIWLLELFFPILHDDGYVILTMGTVVLLLTT